MSTSTVSTDQPELPRARRMPPTLGSKTQRRKRHLAAHKQGIRQHND